MELYKADILRAGEVIDYIDQLRDMPDSAGHFVSTNRAAAEVTYINVENHTAAPVLIKNNRVVTSGKEPGKHGCGLLNVGAIVSRYGGFYTIRYDGDRHMFVLSIQV